MSGQAQREAVHRRSVTRVSGSLAADGLTLLELLVALAIAAVLVTLAVPGMSEIVQHKRGDLVIRRLNQAIELARISAVSYGEVVTLCRSGDGQECGGSWEQGLLVFRDPDPDQRLTDDQQPVAYLDFGGSRGRIFWRAFGNRQYLQFTPLGFTRNQNGNFTYCPHGGDLRQARQLIVNRAGRTRRALDTDGDGIAEDSRGRPLRC